MPPGVVDIPSRKTIQNPFPIRFLSESMPVGKRRAGARPSSRSMRRMDATAAPKNAARTAVAPVFAIEPTQSTLAQMSASRPKGTRVARASCVSARGRIRHVSVPATTAIGAMAQNATRQSPRPASTPPTTGPPSAGMAQVQEIAASMRGHRTAGKTSRTMLCADAISMPQHAGREGEGAAHPRLEHRDGASGASEDRADGVGRRGPRVDREPADLGDGRGKDRGRDERAERGRQDAEDDDQCRQRVRGLEQRGPGAGGDRTCRAKARRHD